MSTHYICNGGCGGVSETPSVCQMESCPKYNKSLIACDCIDGLHGEHSDMVLHQESEKNDSPKFCLNCNGLCKDPNGCAVSEFKSELN